MSLRAAAQDISAISDYGDFNAIPVLHEGRIKPLESFARAHLREFSGKSRLDGAAPGFWLAETLFDPAEAVSRPVFHVDRPVQWNLPPRKTKLFSFVELSAAMHKKMPALEALANKPQKEWSADQHELMALYDKMLRYGVLLRSLSGLLPLAIEVPESLRAELKLPLDGSYTLGEWQKHAPVLRERVDKIIAAKGDNIETYTEEERQIALLGWQIQTVEQAAAGNNLLRIVPPQWGGEEWLSPWELTQTGKGSPAAQAYLKQWETMARAWRAGNAEDWRDAARDARRQAAALPGHGIREWRLTLEVVYQRYPLLVLATLLYGASFIALAMQDRLPRGRLIGKAAFAAGAGLHAASVLARVLILDRPPVGTLYESILFVALICVLAGPVFQRSKNTGLMLSALCGFFLLFVANGFATGDTMPMLVAVLNTDFWLTLHVLCITAGYGFALLAGTLAHVFLLASAGWIREAAAPPQGSLTVAALAALLFTATGTILGGIWADQSWGRFWGWDPKENGALLIVLWLIWALHGRIAGQLDRRAFAACIAYVTVIVALAWFGVNLLATGLHSYGFIEGVATGLLSFCAAETVLIAGLYGLARRRGQGKAA